MSEYATCPDEGTVTTTHWCNFCDSSIIEHHVNNEKTIREEVRRELAGTIDNLIAQLQKERDDFDSAIRKMGF